MKKLLRIAGIAAVVLLVLAAALWGAYELFGKTSHTKPRRTPEPVRPTGDPVLDAINRGIALLKTYQEEDGHFSRGLLDPKPAFTALVVEAMMSAPSHPDPKSDPCISRAVEAILSTQQPDGGFYTPRIGIGNYCTAVSIMALMKVDPEKYRDRISRAVDYILGIQRKGTGDPNVDGGFGYFPSSRPDLSNTTMAIEALREAGLPPDHPAVQAALRFVSRCQNNSETNPLSWVMNDGGFIYRPGESKAGTVDKPGGGKGFRSYGLMTYAGLLSMAYAGVGKDDPRVRAALRWIRKNYSIHENTNLGDAGLFYYYRTMAKALAAAGVKEIDSGDRKHDWARELADMIISLQRPDGSWVNSNDQWMEDDCVLVTAYCVRALSYCWDVMHGKVDLPGSGARPGR